MKGTGSLTPAFLTALGLLLLWETVSSMGLVSAFVLPAPSRVVTTLFSVWPDLRSHLCITLKAALAGLLTAVVFSVGTGFLMDLIPAVRKALYPLFLISQTVPLIALAPLFVLWFGFGILPKILVVLLVCFFPLVVNLLDGLQAVDPELSDMLRTLGAGRRSIFWNVKFPASLSYLFSGLRIAATYSVMGAVIGEWLGGTEGLGVYMVRAQKAFALDRTFAAILLIVVLSFLVFGMVRILEYLVVPWERRR